MNKFQEGDIVKFIDEEGGGKIIKIIDETKVIILDDNGFDYEVDTSSIMLFKRKKDKKKYPSNNQHPQKHSQQIPNPPVQNTITQTSTLTTSLKQIKESSVIKHKTGNILLAFVPQTNHILISDIDIVLINDSNYKLYYQIAVKKEQHFTTIDDNILEPNTQISILSTDRKDLLNLKEIIIRGILILPSFIKEGHPFEEIIKLKPVKFTKEGSFKKNHYFDIPAIIYNIYTINKTVEFSELYQKEQKKPKNSLPQETFNSEKIEIDLHIEKLEKNYNLLSNDQMLDIQKKYFIQTLEKALQSTTVKHFVVIHGIGNGRLKMEIRRILREDYPKLKFEDAAMSEYGFGATLIKIR